MMRVPGRRESLAEARAAGADVSIVYSPLDALALAAKNPAREIVFFATGFETTSPLVAGTLLEAERRGVANFSIFSVHKTVPPAAGAARIGRGAGGRLHPAGHVCTSPASRPSTFSPLSSARRPSSPASTPGTS
jgi:hydrogenase expression/formation protein HypD